MENLIKCYCGHTTTCDCEPEQSPEEETLQKIKFVLLANNDAQAIRLLEQYGGWMQEQDKNKFSEEDLKHAFFSGCQSERRIRPRVKCWEEFIEQFKKK